MSLCRVGSDPAEVSMEAEGVGLGAQSCSSRFVQSCSVW